MGKGCATNYASQQNVPPYFISTSAVNTAFRSPLSAALALLATAAGAFGIAVLLQPLRYFQPASFTWAPGPLSSTKP